MLKRVGGLSKLGSSLNLKRGGGVEDEAVSRGVGGARLTGEETSPLSPSPQPRQAECQQRGRSSEGRGRKESAEGGPHTEITSGLPLRRESQKQPSLKRREREAKTPPLSPPTKEPPR